MKKLNITLICLSISACIASVHPAYARGALDGNWAIKSATCNGIQPIAGSSLVTSYSSPNSISMSFSGTIGSETIVTNNGQCTLILSLLISYPSNGVFTTTPTGNYVCVTDASQCPQIPCGKPVQGPTDSINYSINSNVLAFTSSIDQSCGQQSIPQSGPVMYSANKE